MILSPQEWNDLLQRIASNDPSLTELDLTENQIGDAEVIALTTVLKTNTSLISVNLGRNQIGDAGAAALASALETNTSLTSIILASNQIGVTGAKALATTLKTNNSLTILEIGRNQIGDEGAAALATTLETKNSSLTTLNLWNNQISNAQTEKVIDDTLARNDSFPQNIVNKIFQKHQDPTQSISFSDLENKFTSNPKNSLKILENISQDQRFPESFREQLNTNLKSTSEGLRILVSASTAPTKVKASIPKEVKKALASVDLRDLFKTHGVSKGLEAGSATITKLGEDPLKSIFEFLEVGDIKHKAATTSAAAAVDEDEVRGVEKIHPTSSVSKSSSAAVAKKGSTGVEK